MAVAAAGEARPQGQLEDTPVVETEMVRVAAMAAVGALAESGVDLAACLVEAEVAATVAVAQAAGSAAVDSEEAAVEEREVVAAMVLSHVSNWWWMDRGRAASGAVRFGLVDGGRW